MMLKKFLILLLPLTLIAQVDENITVVLRDIRVHILDADGNPIRGLKKEDFKVYESKTAQDIMYFEEVDLGIPSPKDEPYFAEDEGLPDPERPEGTFDQERKGRGIVIFFDSSNLTKAAFEEMRNVISRFIDEDLSPRDSVKIVQMENRLIHLTSFSSDKAQLQLGLQRAEYKGGFRQKLIGHEQQISDQYDEFARVSGVAGGFAADNTTFIQELADGVFREMDAKEQSKMQHYKTFFYNITAMAKSIPPLAGSKSVYLFTGGNYLQTSGEHKSTLPMAHKLGEVLNNANVTVYPFLYTEKEPVGYGVARSAVSVNETDLEKWQNVKNFASPLYSYRKFWLGQHRNTMRENEIQIQTGPKKAAETTGGFFTRVYSVEQMDHEFRKFNDSTKHYYRIGYTIEPQRQVTKVSIELAGAEKDWQILYGSRFKKPEPFKKMKEEDRQLEFETALLYGDINRNDLSCEFGYQTFAYSKDDIATAVFVGLPTQHFNKDGIEFGFAAFDEERWILDISQSVIKDPGEADKLMAYQVLLSDREPKYIKYYVRNLKNGEFSSREIEVPPQPRAKEGGTLRLSAPAYASADGYHVVPIPFMKQVGKKEFEEETIGAKPKPRAQKDPMVLGNGFLKPKMNHIFERTPRVDVFFHIYGVTENIEDYKVQFIVDNGENVIFPPGQILMLKETDFQTYRCNAAVSTGDIAPGDYRLTVRLSNEKTGESATSFIPLEIHSVDSAQSRSRY